MIQEAVNGSSSDIRHAQSVVNSSAGRAACYKINTTGPATRNVVIEALKSKPHATIGKSVMLSNRVEDGAFRGVVLGGVERRRARLGSDIGFTSTKNIGASQHDQIRIWSE